MRHEKRCGAGAAVVVLSIWHTNIVCAGGERGFFVR